MRKLIVLSAPPGCGKSTWAKRYIKNNPNTVIISSDEIRYELTGSYQDFSKQKEVWELFEKRIVDYAHREDNADVIIDALVDLNLLREKYAFLGKEYARRILVVINKPFEEMIKNNKLRPQEKWVPDDVMQMLYQKFEKPTKEVIDLYDEYIYIGGFFDF